MLNTIFYAGSHFLPRMCRLCDAVKAHWKISNVLAEAGEAVGHQIYAKTFKAGSAINL